MVVDTDILRLVDCLAVSGEAADLFVLIVLIEHAAVIDVPILIADDALIGSALLFEQQYAVLFACLGDLVLKHANPPACLNSAPSPWVPSCETPQA